MTTTLSHINVWNRRKDERTKRNRAAFWIGVGSLFDLRGDTSYRRMQELMPGPGPTGHGVAMAGVSEIMISTPRPSTSPRT